MGVEAFAIADEGCLKQLHERTGQLGRVRSHLGREGSRIRG